jgi:16S rRNA (adenine1518-N6/adenine1519-N6)-dimethyltransferase
VVAIEVDRGLVALLAEAGLPGNVEIRHADALRVDWNALVAELGPPVVLLGNLPYRISGRLLGELLAPRIPFRRMALMLQAEVADRVLAAPGSRDYGPLAVWARLWTRCTRARELGPDEFDPRPKVRSTFVCIEPLAEPAALASPALLRTLVRAAFQHRRKTLRAALRDRLPEARLAFEAAGIDPARRGETLAPLEFARLADVLAGLRGGGA